MILNQLDRKEITVGKACLKYNLSRNTVPNWRKDRENIEKQVEDKLSEKIKASKEEKDGRWEQILHYGTHRIVV